MSVRRVHKVFSESVDNMIDTLIEDFNVKYMGTANGIIVININGHAYFYKPSPESGMTVDTVSSTFQKMMQYGYGRAISWLKRNTILVAGSMKQS